MAEFVDKPVRGEELTVVIEKAKAILRRRHVPPNTTAFVSGVLNCATTHSMLSIEQAKSIDKIFNEMKSGTLSARHEQSVHRRQSLRGAAAISTRSREAAIRAIKF